MPRSGGVHEDVVAMIDDMITSRMAKATALLGTVRSIDGANVTVEPDHEDAAPDEVRARTGGTRYQVGDRVIVLPLLGGASVVVGRVVTDKGTQEQTVGGDEMVDGSVRSTHLFDGPVVLSKHITSEAVGPSHLRKVDNNGNGGAVDANAINSNAIGGRHVQNNAINNGHLKSANNGNGGAVDGSVVNDDAIASRHIGGGAVTSGKIAAGSVGTNHLAADAVTGGKIAAGEVGTNHLAASAVTTNKIDGLAVTGGKLAAGAVGQGKMEKSGGYLTALDANDVYVGVNSGTGNKMAVYDAVSLLWKKVFGYNLRL